MRQRSFETGQPAARMLLVNNLMIFFFFFIWLKANTTVKPDFVPQQNEIFASRHQDVNSVACIEDKCYVLTLAQYCR